MTRYGFILDRLVINHLMLAGILKMNCQKLLFMEQRNSFLAGNIVNLHHITEKCRENSTFIHIRHSSIKYNTQFSPIIKFIFIDSFSRTVQLARSSLIYAKFISKFDSILKKENIRIEKRNILYYNQNRFVKLIIQ